MATIDFFGAGVLFATPKYTAQGIAIPETSQSPVQFGIVQNVTIDDEGEVKELYGAAQYPVDIGRGKSKLSIKCDQAQFSAELFNAVYFGQTLTAGYRGVFAATIGQTIPTGAGATSINITPTAPYGGTSVFASDLGVQGSDGLPFTRVAASPTGGQYSLSGSTYTFSNQDAGESVFINYGYSNATNPADAKELIVYNLPMGQVPVFTARFFNSRNGNTFFREFPACVASKMSMQFKNDDFVIPGFEFSCFADSNNIVQRLSMNI